MAKYKRYREKKGLVYIFRKMLCCLKCLKQTFHWLIENIIKGAHCEDNQETNNKKTTKRILLQLKLDIKMHRFILNIIAFIDLKPIDTLKPINKDGYLYFSVLKYLSAIQDYTIQFIYYNITDFGRILRIIPNTDFAPLYVK